MRHAAGGCVEIDRAPRILIADFNRGAAFGRIAELDQQLQPQLVADADKKLMLVVVVADEFADCFLASDLV